jgi:hypothetical protein
MANKHMKKYSAFPAIKEIQIKIKLRFHRTPVRMAIINNTTTANAVEDVGGEEHLYIVDRM